MAINTLYEFYKTKGQKLPTIAERSKTYEQLGLGSAPSYQGTYSQNVALLDKLRIQPEQPIPSVSTQSQPSAPPGASPVTRVEAKPTGTADSPAVPTLPLKTTVYDQTVPTNVGLFQQYQTDINKRMQELEEKESKVLEAQRALPKQSDLLSSARMESGVTEDIKRAESLDERLAQLEGSLFESERDIRERIKNSGGIVTESQVQRLASAETRPLLEEYNRLSAERDRLEKRISSKESLARESAETQFNDLSRALGIAETDLEFGQKRYEVYQNIAGNLLKASQQDIDQIIRMAESKDSREREEAEAEIDRAFKIAELAIRTPAGTMLDVGGQKIVGLKQPSGSSSSSSTLSPTQFNIRSGLAGLTKDQANDVVTLDTPPAWFRLQEEAKAQATLSVAELQRRWNEVKNRVQSEVEDQEEQDPFELIINQALAGLSSG